VALVLTAQIAAGVLAFALTVALSRNPLILEVKRPFCRNQTLKVLLRAG